MEFVEYNSKNITDQTKKTSRPMNYIFALDESGSMSGSPWDGLMKAIKSSLQEISAINYMKNQFISIFKFNSSTTAVN